MELFPRHPPPVSLPKLNAMERGETDKPRMDGGGERQIIFGQEHAPFLRPPPAAAGEKEEIFCVTLPGASPRAVMLPHLRRSTLARCARVRFPAQA
jgi:hypothetical protein